eukprot:237458_1
MRVFSSLLFIGYVLGTMGFHEDVRYFEMDDGSLINAAIYQLGPTSDADTISPPITVLLPGFMNGRRYWDTLLDVMEKSTLFVGHTIVSISLRGMGDSQYLNLTTHNDYLSNINDIFTILSRLGFESKKCIFI